MNQDALKKQAAAAALKFIEPGMVVGIGTGSTVNYFIEGLAAMRHDIEGAVASSKASEQRLKDAGITVLTPNSVDIMPVYVDGADEANAHFNLIKGGGGALTGEKILAQMADQFICIIDESKYVDVLGTFPLPIEVIPMARSAVAREIVKLGGDPMYREDFVSDHGNQIIDVYNLKIMEPQTLEATLNQIPGVVTNGLFAKRGADQLIIAKASGIEILKR